MPRGKGTATLAFLICALCLGLAASVSSMSILISSSHWTWTRFFACAGLPMSVLLGGLPWCFVHIVEHLPLGHSNWFRSDWKTGRVSSAGSLEDSKEASERKNTLAYFAKDEHFQIFECRAVTSKSLVTFRIASCCAAICIIIGYVSQYIELRQAPAKASGIWLGVEGIFAVIRIMAWNWAPSVLGFSTEAAVREVDQRNHLFKNSLSELELTLCWASARTKIVRHAWDIADPQALFPSPILPRWLVERLDDVKLIDAFALSTSIRLEQGCDFDFLRLQRAPVHWDMSDFLFSRWLELRCRGFGTTITYDATQRRQGVGSWVCRIVKDLKGDLHMVPGVSLRVHHTEMTRAATEVILFSHWREIRSNIFCFPGSQMNDSQQLYQGIEAIPHDHRGLVWLTMRVMEPFYRNVLDQLWTEMFSALDVLELAMIGTKVS